MKLISNYLVRAPRTETIIVSPHYSVAFSHFEPSFTAAVWLAIIESRATAARREIVRRVEVGSWPTPPPFMVLIIGESRAYRFMVIIWGFFLSANRFFLYLKEINGFLRFYIIKGIRNRKRLLVRRWKTTPAGMFLPSFKVSHSKCCGYIYRISTILTWCS